MIALLCALVSAPGALRARICLVALGVIEAPSCCPQPSCCSQNQDSGPVAKAGGDECHCCLDVVLDSNDKSPSKAPAQAGELVAPPMRQVCDLAPAPLPPQGDKRVRELIARERMRPKPAAVLPLRI